MAEHPPHFTRESPRREAPGIPFVEEVFPMAETVPNCGFLRHTWHPLALGLWVPLRCCQCGVTRHRVWQGRAR